MSRVPLLAANWKMFKGPAAAREFLEGFLPTVPGDGAEVFICPPFASLGTVIDVCSGSPVRVASQNMHFEDEGAFTGEVSAPMLVEIGADGVVLGHSERRALFGETDEALARKVRRAIEAGLTPILCVGETEDEREAGRTEEVIETQLRRGLAGTAPRSGAELVLAYEPVWAIGTGRVAQPAQVEEAHGFLRSVLASATSPGLAGEVRILYGGSVNAGNAAGLIRLPEVDGFLVGGASLDPGGFRKILEAAAAG